MPAKPRDKAVDKSSLEAWKTVVGVQMHFNDMEMRIRNFALNVVLAVFGAFGFLISHDLPITIGYYKFQLYVFVPIAGMIAVYLFYFMDFFWYHRLLLGAVKQGMIIEEKFKKMSPELGLSSAIGAASPIEPRGLVWVLAKLLVSDKRFSEQGKLHSDAKI